jgi:hypothetical protein
MAPVTRRRLLQTAGGTGVAALGGAGIASSPLLQTSAAAGSDRSIRDAVFTFVSMPDFFNGDVGDLSKLSSWDGGLNSINQSWRDAIDHCLDTAVAHKPEAIFLAGDMVEGHWNQDVDNRRVFGEVSQGIDPESIALCKKAINIAGDLYYSHSAGLFSKRNLPLYPCVGDHEILDDRGGPLNDRWSPSGFHKGLPDNRYYLVKHCKKVWAEKFTRPGGVPRFARRPRGTAAEFTAYSVSFADALTLITVDVFTHNPHGIRLGVFNAQLKWLREEIRRAKRKGHFVVVQGHIPIMHPVRWIASGRLRIPEERASALYQTLDREGADLYICGEVHDTTAIQHGPNTPMQVSHGCIFEYGYNYLVGQLLPDNRLVLDLYEVPLVRASKEREIWSAAAAKYQRTMIEYGEPVHRGRIIQRGRHVTTRTEKLGVYHPHNDPYDLRHHSPTVVV